MTATPDQTPAPTRRRARALESRLAQLGRYQVWLWLLLSGLLSLWHGKDFNWDMKNYHYYNPWAWLHHRADVDLFAAQLQTFFNPLIDTPFYLLAHAGVPDYLVVFLMGLPTGLAASAVWAICGQLQARAEGPPSRLMLANRLTAALIAASGSAGHGQLGSATGEWTTTCLLMLGILALTMFHVGRLPALRAFALAGVAFGAAGALKLAAMVPLVGLSLAAAWIAPWGRRRDLARAFIGFAAGGVGAFLVLAGPWMWSLAVHWGSPLFPMFNDVFHSPYADASSWRDLRTVAQDAREVLVFPFREAFLENKAHSELKMRDPRVLIALVISAVWVVRGLVDLLRRRAARTTRYQLFLVTGFVTTYLIWIRLFGIYRYAIILEAMAALMMFVAVNELLGRRRPRAAVAAAVVAYGACVGLVYAPNWGSIDMTGGRYFTSRLPALPPGAMVLAATDEPVSFLIPQWPGAPPFVSAATNFSAPGRNEPAQRLVAARLAGHRGPIYLLRAADPAAARPDVLARYHLVLDSAACVPIMAGVPLTLCPAHRQ